jgi:hypothetical protein
VNEVIVVVGAGSIGQAITRRVSAGKHVVLADLHEENANTAAEVMLDAGFEVSTATVDVSSRESVHALIETATGFGDITDSSMPPESPPARPHRQPFSQSTCTELRYFSKRSGTSSRLEVPGWSSRRCPVTDWAPSPPSTTKRWRPLELTSC